MLNNGFAVDCHHRATLANGRVRLFLKEDDASYMDVDAERIRSVEITRDASPTATLSPAVLPQVPVPRSTLPSDTLETLLAQQSSAHRLDVNLLKSVVQAESGGRIHAVSHSGAQGLMQLMPTTARALGVTDSFAPDQNLGGGTTYLDRLLVRYHEDLALALAAYNAGPGAVDRYHGMPPFHETQAYVARIIREFNRRSLVMARSSTSSVQVVR